MNNSRRNSLEKSSIQPIVAGFVGTALLVASVVFYALKIDITVAVVVGIACIGFALYNIQHQARESKKCGAAYYSISFESNVKGYTQKIIIVKMG